MEIEYWYIFSAILGAISIVSIIFCIVRGKGAPHKMLVFFVSMIGVVAVIGFGGEAALNLFGMGWRCTPVNVMLMLCGVFFIAALCCSIWQLITLKVSNAVTVGCVASLSLAIFITLLSALGYFWIFSWHDGLTTYDGETIVYATDEHGGSAAWRYYAHINDLVHGVEITQDGWHGTRLWDLAS